MIRHRAGPDGFAGGADRPQALQRTLLVSNAQVQLQAVSARRCRGERVPRAGGGRPCIPDGCNASFGGCATDPGVQRERGARSSGPPARSLQEGQKDRQGEDHLREIYLHRYVELPHGDEPSEARAGSGVSTRCIYFAPWLALSRPVISGTRGSNHIAHDAMPKQGRDDVLARRLHTDDYCGSARPSSP